MKFRVELRWHVDRVALRVADTGVGIPAVDLPRTFDRFHRVKNVRARTRRALSRLQLAASLGQIDFPSLKGEDIQARHRVCPASAEEDLPVPEVPHVR